MTDMTKVSKIPPELSFLWEISGSLAGINDNQLLLENLKLIFSKYLNTKEFRIIVRDENTSTLRDFVKNWIVVSSNIQNEAVEDIFSKLKNIANKGIVINNKLIKSGDKIQLNKKEKESFENIINLKQKNNILYFPVTNEKNLTGLIEIVFDSIDENIKNEKFLAALKIAISQINSVVTNKILNKKLCANIKFQQVMKSIAKLIETQFDINYILPIIGELIDRFVEDHLIYIFTREQNETTDEYGDFNLFWPADCQDNAVFSLLKTLKKSKNEKSHLITKDRKTAIFAIRNEEQTVGAIAASSNIDKLSQTDIDYLSQLSAQASITTQRANSYGQVLKYATMDALTGLNNRRQFEVRLKQEFSNAKRNKKPLCCIMLDIDYFKKVNDTWGHSAGDCILKNVAKIVAQGLREYDIASRYGGEEFCILLPETKLREAAFVAQRLRASVEQADINISDDQLLGCDTLKVTISVGVSEFNESFETPEKLYQCADIALYEAKKRGRNRVVVYDETIE